MKVGLSLFIFAALALVTILPASAVTTGTFVASETVANVSTTDTQTAVTATTVANAAQVKASRTLTVVTEPADGETITIGTCVVTFQTGSSGLETNCNDNTARIKRNGTSAATIASNLRSITNLADAAHGALAVSGSGTNAVFTTSGTETSATDINYVNSTGADITNLTTVTGVISAAQVNTITIGASVEVGDVFTANLPGAVTASFTAVTTDPNDVAIGLNAAIAASLGYAGQAFTSASLANVVTLTAKVSGTGFVETSGTTNATNVAQVVTFTPAMPTNGETFRATINGTDYDHVVSGSETVGQAVEALQPLMDASATVTCTEDDTKVTCTADVAGTAFTFAATVLDAPLGTIIINKTSVGGADTFDFTTTGSDIEDFDIDTTQGPTKTFNNVSAGTYTVTEVDLEGWNFTSLECSDVTSDTTTEGKVATINVAPGETVTCTYTNTAVVVEIPGAVTVDATGITTSDATLNGTNGPVAATNHTFWASTDPFVAALPVPGGIHSTPLLGPIAAGASWSSTLSSITVDGVPTPLAAITPGTTYYFAAWVEVNGTWYPGEILNFTTSPVAPSEFVKVHIYKYLDDEAATPTSATSTTFNMASSWDAENIGASSGTYSLNAAGYGDGAYVAVTSEMTNGADYSTNEVLDGSVVSSTCSEGVQYNLVGYRIGNTLEAAEAAELSTEVMLTNITSDKYVIVVNHYCGSPVQLGTVKVKIKKYIDGAVATEESSDGVVFGMQSSWSDTPGAGAGTYSLSSANSFTAETSEMQMGTADYTTSETFDTDTAVSCNEVSKFELVGYSFGESFSEAQGADVSLTPPTFNDIQTNKFVIVWNETCVPAPTTGTLTIVKNVINDDEGSAIATDFSFEVTGNETNETVAGSTEGVAIDLAPGTYSISELNGEGYDASFSESCSAGSVTIVAGQSVTCTVTNDDKEPEPETPSTPSDDSSQTSSGTGFGSFSGGGSVLGASTGPDGETLSCPAFITGYILPGGANDVANVVHLQIFLNLHENAGLAITGVYDAATIAAVNAFQAKYSNEILAPWVKAGLLSTLSPTGNVGKMTSWWINVTVCGLVTPAPLLP